MDAIELWYRGEKIREFTLGERPLELGRAPYCDIVVHDPGVADRELLLSAERGSLFAYDLRDVPTHEGPRVVPRETPVPIGAHHALVRVSATPSRTTEEPGTSRILREPLGHRGYQLVVGRSREARRFAIGRRPVSVGSAVGNTVVLHDPTVSRRHLRLEPCDAGLRVRDLGSRNGTFLEGMRIENLLVTTSVALRIGRTELVLEADGTLPGADAIVAAAPASFALLAQLDRVARLPFPVLLLGESGVGKEALARRVHASSPRAQGPLVCVNAGAFSPELAGSELFGHEKGAFTGASNQHAGVFEQAHGGTLFLDEVGELSLDLQAKLLRVLEQGTIRRVGGRGELAVDVRIVAATHRALPEMVASGTFRADLYYRLAQLPLRVPALRERPEDILPIAEHLLVRLAGDVGERTLGAGARASLLAHPFPGNVRELRNVLLAAATSTADREIDGETLRAVLKASGIPQVASRVGASALDATLADFGGNVAAAARALGVPRTTLRDRARRAARRESGRISG